MAMIQREENLQNANFPTFVSSTVLIYEFQRKPFAIATPHQDQENWVKLKEFESNCICCFLNQMPCDLPKFNNCFKNPSWGLPWWRSG